MQTPLENSAIRRPLGGQRASSSGVRVGAIGSRLGANGLGPKDANERELLSLGYLTLGPIAAGAFSTVVRARQLSTKREVAIKSFSLSARAGKAATPEQVAAMRHEIAALVRGRGHKLNPSIANLLEARESPHAIHLVLEYCAGGSLHRHLQKLKCGIREPDCGTWLIQLAGALAYLHSRGVTHRDVKPANLVFEDAQRKSVRLVDFGCAACHLNDEAAAPRRLHTLLGTPCYMAPELLETVGQSKVGYLGPPVDVWAMGVVAYQVLHNRLPFRGETMAQLQLRILKRSFEKFDTAISPPVRGLVKRVLTVDATERPHASAVAEAFETILAPRPSSAEPERAREAEPNMFEQARRQLELQVKLQGGHST
jgi:serine/threonine protein kinase